MANKIEKTKKTFKNLGLQWSLSFLSIIVITSFLVILGIIFSLISSTNVKSNDFKKLSLGKNRYTIVDNFYDANKFYEFRQSSKNINILGGFYNELIDSHNFELLSIFDQPLELENFKGNNKFYYNTSEFLDNNKVKNIAIKSIQINNIAFNYHDLKTQEGHSFDWNKVSYDKDTLPILIGSDYVGTYEIGDIIKGNYYNEEKKLKIIGILEKNSSIYYANDPEFYLDEYIIVPYPKKLWLVNNKDYIFESILYFALINSDIVTSLNENLFIEEIKKTANQTGFTDFSLVGIDEFKIKYIQLISIVEENKKILTIMLSFIYFLVFFILYGFSRIIIDKRFLVYKTHWLIGDRAYNQLFFKDISTPYIIGYIISIIFQFIFFKNIFVSIILIQFVILLITFICISYSGNKFIEKKINN